MKPICFKRVLGNEFQLTVDYTSHVYSVFAKLRERKLRDRHYARSVTNRFIKLAAFRFWGCLMGLRRPNAGLPGCPVNPQLRAPNLPVCRRYCKNASPAATYFGSWNMPRPGRCRIPGRSRSRLGFLSAGGAAHWLPSYSGLPHLLATLDRRESNNARAGRSTRG